MASKRKQTKLSPESTRRSKRRASSSSDNPDEEVKEVSMEPVEGNQRRSKRKVSVSPKISNQSRSSSSRSDEVKPKKKSAVKPDAANSAVIPQPQDDSGEDDDGDEVVANFLGDPVPMEEAKLRWPHRYTNERILTESGQEIAKALAHYLQAEVDGQVYSLEDDAFVKADPGKEDYIGKIKEFFQAKDGSQQFRAQWYYRPYDTVIQNCDEVLANEHKLNIDKQCVFFSEVKDDNPLGCLVKKIRIERLPLKVDSDEKEKVKSRSEFYCDRMYLLPFTSFVSLETDGATESNESGSTISSDCHNTAIMGSLPAETDCNEKTVLDLYSGCGAMSTGLCLGANNNGLKLVTKWAVDINEHACASLRLNHPETQVRNEAAENYLSLIKEWWKLCCTFLSLEVTGDAMEDSEETDEGDAGEGDSEEETDEGDAGEGDAEVYEVEDILDICYGNPEHEEKSELHFKIRWKGYGPGEDSWEPIESLNGCQEKLKEYVHKGYKSKMLPLPGMVDVICGGPPCQGISGFNRFRNDEQPLNDPKNKQLIVFMDIVAYLRPKFVLMENVVDIVKFADGVLGRYAMGRLVSMDYQARMGLMAAGAYGLPQFRMRMFMWGALPGERLPQYPLPTHDVVIRGNVPLEFEANAVAFDVGHEVELKGKLFLGDAISDLPPVKNDEPRDQMPYSKEAETDFQRFIRLRRDEMPGSLLINSEDVNHQLYDHRPLCLNQDDYERVCMIPKEKGANFRNLPGVRVRADNKVEWDPNVERQKVSSGKPLVPDYAMSFVKGKSSKPFGRLWWTDTVPTVVTRAEPHNQVILHPKQDRVLTIRENARLQGFPDYYRLLGPIKERYMQVGNAVAVPVARALGFSLAKAFRGHPENDPMMTLPIAFQ